MTTSGALVKLLDEIETRWSAVQAFFARATELPSDPDDFTTRYGFFQDDGSVNAFTSAVAAIRVLAQALGTPASQGRAGATSAGYRTGASPPTEAYGRWLWSLGRLAMAAHEAPEELAATLSAVSDALLELAEQLEPFQERLRVQVSALGDTLTLHEANERIGRLGAALPELRGKLESAQRKARSTHLFRTTAEKDHAAAEAAQHEVATAEEGVRRAERLTTDLAGVSQAGREALRALNWLAGAGGSIGELGRSVQGDLLPGGLELLQRLAQKAAELTQRALSR